MKIQANDNAVERFGVASETSFSIKASGKAFKILSDGLYSNKIGAIIRELSCNAYDAHVAAGKKDIPFNIHLPTKLEPWFAVRDYGVGLSHEDVCHLYSTYFESTKNTSNDYVGAFGLGSKSPFCYVDSFSVVSRFNGEKRSYSAFITESEIPSIALIHSEKTTDGNGLEVQVPVKEYDCENFTKNAKIFLEHFNPTPIVNDFNFLIDRKQPVLKGKNWKYFASKSWNSSDFTIVQGGVPYTFDSKTFNSYTEISNKAKNLLENFKMTVTVDIGQIEIAASREAISFTKNTMKELNKILDKVYDELGKEFIKYIDELKGTDWERKIQIYEFYKNNNHSLFNEYKVDSDTDYVIEFKDNFLGLQFDKKDSQSKRKLYHYSPPIDVCIKIRPERNYKIFVKDICRPLTWLENYFENEEGIDWTNSKVLIIHPSPECDYKEVISFLGDPNYILYSSLKKPAKMVRFEQPPKYLKVIANYSTWDQKPQDYNGALPNEGFYIIRKNQSLMYKDAKFEKFRSVIDKAVKMGWIDKEVHEKIFVFNNKQIKKLDSSSWTNVLEMIEEKTKDWLNSNKDAFTLYQKIKSCTVSDRVKNQFKGISNQPNFKKIKGSILAEACTICKEYSELKLDEEMLELAKNFSISIDSKEKAVSDLMELKDKILERYPLLKYVIDTYHYDSNCYNDIINYVESIEMTIDKKIKEL